jgi:hypothetical protein
MAKTSSVQINWRDHSGSKSAVSFAAMYYDGSSLVGLILDGRLPGSDTSIID